MTAPSLDPRIHAYREEIADIALAEKIALPHYVEPVKRSIRSGLADLRTEASDDAELGSQLLYGERFALLDEQDGWAWGYGLHDNFVGFVRTESLAPAFDTTHMIATSSTMLAGKISIELGMGSFVAGTQGGDRLVTADGAIPISDVLPIDAPLDDPVAAAEMLIGAPYLLGGRSVRGIDCSGIVQLSLRLAGHSILRDSDMQQASVGAELAPEQASMRGDLIFFPQHVGMMVDDERLIHASAHTGTVCVEPLVDVAARIGETHETPILARRRIA